VVLSAYNEFHLVKEAFKSGAMDYLLKSEITREELLEVLARTVAGLEDGRGSASGPEEPGSEVPQARNPLVRKTLEYIAAHLAEDLCLSQIARHLGVCEVHISRTFSREMRCSFVKYLARARMNTALRLLRDSELKIYEIAERTGYRNPEHFSRTFKKIMGASPKEYR
jgi:two-component system response regulator YesN